MPVSLIGRQLQTLVLLFSGHEKKCLNIVHAVEMRWHYLDGEECKGVYYRKFLIGLLISKELKEGLPRWVHEIQYFDFIRRNKKKIKKQWFLIHSAKKQSQSLFANYILGHWKPTTDVM